VSSVGTLVVVKIWRMLVLAIRRFEMAAEVKGRVREWVTEVAGVSSV